MLCSICIPTYKRTELLERLLKSLYNQNLEKEYLIEIIVVDNDSEASARDLCKKFSDTQNIRLYYFVQPVKNISITRNKAVSKAKGQYVFFIDDDEYVCQNWISMFLRTIEQYQADGVFGKVVSEFSENCAAWLKGCYIFNKPSIETGSETKFTSTANCVIKRSILEKYELPFDPKYGLTGGEDTKLFYMLRKSG